MDYYHLGFGCFRAPELDEDWVQRAGWYKLFCRDCGTRLDGVQRIDIKITSTQLPFMIGSFALPDVGFVRGDLIQALGVNVRDYLWLGNIVGSDGQLISNVYTFVGRQRCVPVRGRDPLTSDGCSTCKRLVFISHPQEDRYVVCRSGLKEPIYESNENGLILRGDLLERVRSMLEKRICVERLTIETQGFDGRCESELEYQPY